MSNDCYVQSLMQCLRLCTPCTTLNNYIPPHRGEMGDPHDLYMQFISSVPDTLSSRYMIHLSNGDGVPFLSEYGNRISCTDKITHAPEILCIYRIPTPMYMNSMYYIDIDVGTTTHRYRIQCCICYQHGSNGSDILRWHGYIPPSDGIDHYYSITDQCNDRISEILPIYMLFYRRII